MQILAVKQNAVANSTISQYTYGVNNLGQRDGVTTAGSAFGNANRGWTWGYDALGQATKAVNAANTDFNRAFVYDNIGNRTSATDGSGGTTTTVGYTPNALNQYTTINPGTAVNPDFDADGNLKADAGINGMGYGLKYEWDAENRITVVRKTDTTLLATYVYDHIGRRIRKTTTAAAFQGVSDTAYFYDGFNVVAEYTLTNSGGDAALLQAYTWGLDLSGSMQGAGGVGGLLCIHRVPGINDGNRTWTDTFYPTYDGNGNVSEYLDKNGAEVAHFEYDPFGRVVHSTGTPALFTYRFSTKQLDFETGLYYYLYRYYDPITGRWPSRDPIEEEGGLNLYGFVRNNGVGKWDLYGLWFADGLSRFGIKTHGIVLDGKGQLRTEMRTGASPIKQTHEATHIYQISGGVDPRTDKNPAITKGPVSSWNAIPYKQLFKCCQFDKGKPALKRDGTFLKSGWCYFENVGSNTNANFTLKAQAEDEGDYWKDGRGVWKHSDYELAHLEIPVLTWEASKTTNSDDFILVKNELTRMENRIRKDDKDKPLLDDTVNSVWTAYKAAYANEKVKYHNAQLEWVWKHPKNVYAGL